MDTLSFNFFVHAGALNRFEKLEPVGVKGMRRRDRDDDSVDMEEEDSDASTNSECEYRMDMDLVERLASRARIDSKPIEDAFIKQSGTCRITGIPFDESNPPSVVARILTKPLSKDNCILVLGNIERMRNALNVPWRVFVRLLQMYAKDAEL